MSSTEHSFFGDVLKTSTKPRSTQNTRPDYWSKSNSATAYIDLNSRCVNPMAVSKSSPPGGSNTAITSCR